MKKMLFGLFTLTILTLMIPGAGIAEPTDPNELGLYTSPDGFGATGTTVMGAPVLVYLVLTKPADVENGNAPYPDLNAFECRLKFDPVPDNDLLLLDVELPPSSIDIGLVKDINEGSLDFIVGISSDEPLPVVDEAAVLVTLTFMNLNSGTTVVTLGPTWPQSIPGEMAFQSEPSELRIMHSIGGSHSAGVFEFNGEAVAVQSESFGSVKALFR